ncbi:MAG: S8 family serine peptidase [Elusimicrobia bacterium]|nr:S8 family serine peptidase [Elusimicrobiota bacterium]
MRRSELAAALLLASVLAVPARALRVETVSLKRSADGVSRPVEVVSERAMVRFSTDAAPANRAAVLGAVGARINQEFPALGWTVVGLPPGLPVATALGRLRTLPGVLAVEPDYAYRPVRTPNDPSVNSEYQLSKVDAFGAWEYEVGTSCRTTIAVIDAGIDATQTDLSGKMTGLAHQFCDPGADKVLGTDDVACTPVAATPACNHATHVAGVAAATTDNGAQVAGMSWGAQLLSLKVFRDADCNMDCSDNAGQCATDDQAIANALAFAVARQNTAAYGHIVANLSLGGTGACAGVVQTAVNNALAAGIPVVAAAGNDGSAVNSPGNCAGVIVMGASDASDNVTSFSSRGAEMASNGLVAPGSFVVTTDVGNKTTTASGTSFSSPMGAGLAALILSAKPTAVVNGTQNDVKTWMRAGAQDVGQSSTVQGAGRMNAYRSLRLAVKGTLAGFDGEQKPIAFPNPFRISQSPMVSFAIPPGLSGSGLSLKIYTVDGGFVRELNSLVWDGKNAEGTLVASGTYVFVVKTSKGESRGRMAVIR